MSINPLNSSNIPRTSNLPRVDSAGVEQSGSKKSNAAQSTQSSETVQETGVQPAKNPIEELPDIRQDVIQQALKNLESGYYQSREAAVQTAKAILE